MKRERNDQEWNGKLIKTIITDMKQINVLQAKKEKETQKCEKKKKLNVENNKFLLKYLNTEIKIDEERRGYE